MIIRPYTGRDPSRVSFPWRGNPHPELFVALVLSVLPLTALAQTTAPTEDALFKDIDTAHQDFKAAVPQPTDISDPTRRTAIAPKAIPPLRRLVADYQQLAKIEPKMSRRTWQIAQQFKAFLSVLGDQPTITELQEIVDGPDLEASLNARSSQLLAQWIAAGKNPSTQSELAGKVKSLDVDHPASEALTFLTVTLSESAVSTTLRQTLLQQARQMQNPLAFNVRRMAAATKP